MKCKFNSVIFLFKLLFLKLNFKKTLYIVAFFLTYFLSYTRSKQETSILDEYNINWTQKLGAGISGPVR